MIKLSSDKLLASGFVKMFMDIVWIFEENNFYFLDV